MVGMSLDQRNAFIGIGAFLVFLIVLITLLTAILYRRSKTLKRQMRNAKEQARLLEEGQQTNGMLNAMMSEMTTTGSGSGKYHDGFLERKERVITRCLSAMGNMRNDGGRFELPSQIRCIKQWLFSHGARLFIGSAVTSPDKITYFSLKINELHFLYGVKLHNIM